MHRLLLRQLKRVMPELSDPATAPEPLARLLQLVDEAYRQFEDEQEILDRSLEISSAELIQHNALARAVFQSLPDVFIWLTTDGRIKDCRGGVAQLFGTRPEELVGRVVRDCPELGDPAIFQHALDTLTHTHLFQTEYTLRRADRGLHCEARFAVLDDQTRLALIRDISSQVQAREAERAIQDRLDRIIEFLPDPTLVVDNEHRVIAWNKALEDMTGIPKEAMLGKGDHEYALPFYGYRRPILLDFIGKDPSPAYPMYTADQGESEALASEIFVPTLHGGRGAFIWATATPLHDDQGTIVGAIQAIRDVTEKKRAEIATRVLHQISTAIAGASDERAMLDNVFRILAEHLKILGAYVAIADPTLGLRTYPFFQDQPPTAKKAQTKSPIFHLIESVIHTGQARNLRDRGPSRSTLAPSSWLGQPIHGNGRILGALAVWLEDTAALLLGPEGALLTSIADHLGQAMVHAMTAKALRDSEKKYRSIFENATEGIFQVSLDQDLLSANPAMAQILGYASVDALMAESTGFLRRMLPSQERVALLDRLLTTNVVNNLIFATTRQDGAQTWLSANIRAVRTSNGAIEFLEGSLEDVSERRAMEHDLNVQKKLFQQLFDNSPQPILLLGPSGIPLDLNPSFTQLFGLTLRDQQALFEILLAPGRLEESYAFLASVLSGRSEFRETLRPRKDGRTIPVSILGYPYMIDDQIAGAFLVFTDISERKDYEERLTQQALRDNLTGLANRTLLLDRLTQAIARRKRKEDYRFAVLMIDLDGFKRVNDTLGHQAGDQLLQEISHRLSSCLRAMDTVARLGGDEFAILLEDFRTNREAIVIIRRILNDTRQPMRIMGREVAVSASIGVVLNTGPYTSPNELLRDADISMYRSKEQGKNQFKVFSKSMYDQVVRAVQREQDLHGALANNEFELYFQPIYSVKTKSLRGFEALIRWNHPTDGLLPPGAFLDSIEAAGLEMDLSRWTLRHGCQALGLWKRHFPHLKISLSVNLSPKDLTQATLVTFVSDLLRTEAVDARSLKLEITETAVMNDPEQAIAKLERLKLLGIAVAMDDFGTGYSSLSYLQRLPVDILKIDRSFISTMLGNPDNLEIVRTIIGLGKILQKRCVAEGVETEPQLRALTEMDCDFCQGFLLGRPMPQKAVMAMLGTLAQNRHETDGESDWI
ncbi:MAG: bifunctional diguanylate cyclase/phosphodiesterase [Deltaproteobacteria bacterium]|nr:bifunctional diguanylate cyclase/phosphodiesterase [Deltaproteobacteria bacterium]